MSSTEFAILHEDNLQDFQQEVLNKKLDNISKNIPPFTGKCRECAEPITKGYFCGIECRDEYEAKRRSG